MSVTTRSTPMVLRPQSFQELTTFAQMAAKSSLVPKDYQGKPENIMLAIQMGSELGLAPMQALQNVAVINGRPAVWGDALLALVQAHPDCVDVQEGVTGDGDNMVARCVVKRLNRSPVSAEFSVADAKKANLWNKGGPWQQYPRRMLQMRARGFALRDAFPDALKGIISAEEARDIPKDTPRDDFRGTTIDAQTEEPVSAATHTQPQTPDLTTRMDRAISAIQEAATTPEAFARIEAKVRPLIAALDEAGRANDKAILVETLDEYRQAIPEMEPAQ